MLTAAGLVWGLTVGLSNTAAAAEYPSWEDVEQARSSEAATRDQISELNALLTALESELEQAQAAHRQRSGEYENAQAAFDDATYRASSLQSTADEATQRASQSRQQAGQLAAALSRAGGGDVTMALLTSPQSSDLLRQLATMGQLTARTDAIYATARSDSNTAAALTAQAEIARGELKALSEAAESALQDAIDARAVVESRLQEQQDSAATLRAQLDVLTQDRAATEADYQAGEQARRDAEAAAAQAAETARIAAAAAAASAAAQAPPTISFGNPGLAPAPTPAANQGWVRPVSGRISSVYGPRPNRPVPGVGAFHYGTDIAAGCGVPMVAASAGVVSYSGPLGTYGNWILLNHGNGIETGYAHNSTNLVREGERVAVGQLIALVGSTGASSGCHLHYETRVNGARIDPQPFMNQRGASLG